MHSETAAVPLERLQTERSVLRPLPVLRPPLREGEIRKVDCLGMVRFGSGRYAVPQHLVGADVEIVAHEDLMVIRHAGAVRRSSATWWSDRARSPSVLEQVRHVNPRAACGRERRRRWRFIGLGPSAETYLRTAAAAGTLRLEHELKELAELEAVWGRSALIRALERGARYRRFKATDVRAILMAGNGVPTPMRPGQQLQLDLPEVPTRPLSAYAVAALR